jgi:hypothetical protein
MPLHPNSVSRWFVANGASTVALADLSWAFAAPLEKKKAAGESPISLVDAVKKFNNSAATNAVGLAEPLLTEDEVIASLRGVIRSQHPRMTDDVYNALKRSLLHACYRQGEARFHRWLVRAQRLLLYGLVGGRFGHDRRQSRLHLSFARPQDFFPATYQQSTGRIQSQRRMNRRLTRWFLCSPAQIGLMLQSTCAR